MQGLMSHSNNNMHEGHRSPKVLGKYYSYSTGVFAHGYLRASTSETHAQVSETARTGAAAGHSGESGRERRHAPLWGALPLRGPHPYIRCYDGHMVSFPVFACILHLVSIIFGIDMEYFTV